jgi:hypothetical protein
MNDTELMVRSVAPSGGLVPIDYAEKAMGSLMQLHSELMEEKERRVDLYRRLMEREQAVAELRMYVKLLEEKVAKTEAPAKEPTRSVPERRPPVHPERTHSVHAERSPGVHTERSRGAAPRPPPPPPRPLTLIRSPPVVRAVPSPAPLAPVENVQATAGGHRAAARGFSAQDGWKAW